MTVTDFLGKLFWASVKKGRVRLGGRARLSSLSLPGRSRLDSSPLAEGTQSRLMDGSWVVAVWFELWFYTPSLLLSIFSFTLIESGLPCLSYLIFFISLLLLVFLPTWNALPFLLKSYNPFIFSEKINHGFISFPLQYRFYSSLYFNDFIFFNFISYWSMLVTTLVYHSSLI